MGLTSDLEHKLQPIISLLIRAGSDLSLCNSDGYSACSLIFQSKNGLPFLQEFVFTHVDIFTLQEIEGVDLWVLAALSRGFPHFRRCLEAQLAEFRTPPELSASPRRQIAPPIELDAPSQVADVVNAQMEIRYSFLILLCAKGTLDMVKPFLACGIDLDESGPTENKTYIRAAARSGNVDIVAALADAGASLDNFQPWMMESEILPATNVLDDLLERWYSIRFGRPEYTGDPETEYWILSKLLRNPTFKPCDSIFFAIGRHEDPRIYESLLRAGCGRRDGMPADTRARAAVGSEIIWAVRSNSRVVELLIDHGLGIEFEDRLGFTALLHALDRGKGRKDFTKLLIDFGVDLTRRTSSGFTPLEFAERKLKEQHPRHPRRDGIIMDWPVWGYVTLEQDQESYELLRRTIKERQPTRDDGWLKSEHTSFIVIYLATDTK